MPWLNMTYRILLLIHDIVVHFRAENGTVVQEPNPFHFTNVVAFGNHVLGFRDTVEKGETAAYLVVDLLEDGFLYPLTIVLHTVVSQSLHSAVFGEVFDLVYLHARGILLEPLKDPVLVRVDNDSCKIGGGPLLSTLLD